MTLMALSILSSDTNSYWSLILTENFNEIIGLLKTGGIFISTTFTNFDHFSLVTHFLQKCGYVKKERSVSNF